MPASGGGRYKRQNIRKIADRADMGRSNARPYKD